MSQSARHGAARLTENDMHDTNHQPIASEQIKTERKTFFIDLKENARGRVYKITEDVNGRRDTIMLPAEHAQDFAEALLRLVQFEGTL